ncbi:hypothetical protein GCM10009677_59750 [Sphaerisporangium rubeum]
MITDSPHTAGMDRSCFPPHTTGKASGSLPAAHHRESLRLTSRRAPPKKPPAHFPPHSSGTESEGFAGPAVPVVDLRLHECEQKHSSRERRWGGGKLGPVWGFGG